VQTLTNAVVQGNAECDAAALAEEIREVVVEPEVPDHVEDVRIMSLHKSKGLSANVVISAVCVEGVLPRMPDR
jgi:DNA helicase-2/ATP-dependent DNA helicase PcrA